MEQISTDDLRKAMKLISHSLTEERVGVVAPALNQLLQLIQPLTKLPVPKELEPTTYLARLQAAGRAKRSAND